MRVEQSRDRRSVGGQADDRHAAFCKITDTAPFRLVRSCTHQNASKLYNIGPITRSGVPWPSAKVILMITRSPIAVGLRLSRTPIWDSCTTLSRAPCASAGSVLVVTKPEVSSDV